MSKRRIQGSLLAVFLAALLIRMLYVLPRTESFRDEDEEIYVTIARNALAGRGLIFNQFRQAAFPPLYPIFLAGLFQLGAGTLQAVRVIQAVMGAFSCLWLAGITRLAFPAPDERERRAAATLAAGMMAVYPMLVYYSALLLTEIVCVFLLLMGLYFLLSSLDSSFSSYWLGAGGAALGLGILCRPSLLPLAFFVPPWIAFSNPKPRAFLKRGAWFLLPLIAVLLPWEIRNYRLFHQVIPITTQSGNILYLANNPLSTGGTVSIRKFLDAGIYHAGEDEGELEYSRRYGHRAREFIRENPRRFFGLAWRRLIWFYHFDCHNRELWFLLVPFWGLLLGSLAGIWLTRRWWRRTSLLLAVILNFTLVHMVFPPEGRYRLPVMPLIMAFTAVAVIRMGKGKTGRSGRDHE